MPLGVEYGAPFQLVGADGTRAVFNNSADADFVGILSPESSGLDSAEVREDASDATEEDGGVHGNFFYGRRPIVLQGTVIASSKADRAAKIAKIKRASNCMRADGSLSWTDGGMATPVECKVRRQQPVRFSKGWVKDFMIPLVAAYPYLLGQLSTKSVKPLESPQKSVVKNPGSQTVIKYGGFGEHGEGAWSPGTSGAETEDGVFTTSELLPEPVKMLYLVLSKFGFAVPAGATIIGVEVGIKKKASATNAIEDYEVRLINQLAGGLVGENRIQGGTWLTTNQFYGHGGAKDLWGATLTPTIVNQSAGANEFGVAILPKRAGGWSAGKKAEIDVVKMTVYYKEATYPEKTVTITNAGDAASPPRIFIRGAIENPVIRNQTTGEEIHLIGNIPAGTTVQIDVKNRTVKNLETGANLYSMVDFATTTWWKIQSGANVIGIRGDYTDANSELVVEATDNYV
jgi:hypothetical protein